MSAPAASASAPAAAASIGSSPAEQAAFLAGAPASSLSPLAQQLLASAQALFASSFGFAGPASELSVGVAPGRVNLIGEHTDYNGGFVCPLAIDRHTVVIGRRNGLDRFRIVSANTAVTPQAQDAADGDQAMASGAAASASATSAASTAAASVSVVELTHAQLLARYSGERVWHNYFRGVVAQFVEQGKQQVPCFDVAIAGNVPLGGGLSSSASLEVATAAFLQSLLGLPLDGVTRALWCQRCEHDFCNCPCGVMDQFIASLAKKDHVMLLDCRSLVPTMVPFTDPSVAILITNSNVAHGLGDGQYEIRVQQCAAAVSVLQIKFPHVKQLRDATLEQLNAVEQMMDEDSFFRARHVITENDRTQRCAALIAHNDYARLGQLMTHSHVSMKNDYEISCDEVDCLVDIALELPGVFGSRMTGGGFGGCTVTLVAASEVDKVAEAIREEYREQTGIEATTIITRPAAGATIIKL